MAHFYLREDLDVAVVGDEVVLNGAEAKHVATVSRTRVGEAIVVGNGRGLVVRGVVSAVSPGEVIVRADGVSETPAPERTILLAQALAKGGRDEMAIQAATELGVDGVIPWAAERSISRWTGDKVAKGQERWSSIVREATKQALRPWLPVVEDLATTKQLAALAVTHRVLVLEPTADLRLSDAAGNEDPRDVVLVVGPEGGLSPAELKSLEAAGAVSVRLGVEVLRTSTAGPAALAVLNAALGRW